MQLNNDLKITLLVIAGFKWIRLKEMLIKIIKEIIEIIILNFVGLKILFDS